jgi:hypothetical protein
MTIKNEIKEILVKITNSCKDIRTRIIYWNEIIEFVIIIMNIDKTSISSVSISNLNIIDL